VTTRFIVVGEAYVTVPAKVPLEVTAPVVVFVKPVPVNTTFVPNASPCTKLGACEAITGPATVTAGVYVVPATVAGAEPSVTPEVAAALKVYVVPAAPLPAVNATSVYVVEMAEYELKPVPVNV
jgi:hypothetical protein